MNWRVARIAFFVVLALGVVLLIPTTVLIAPSARMPWAISLVYQVPFLAVIVAAIAGALAGLLGRQPKR
jgi:hypothetical protein